MAKVMESCNYSRASINCSINAENARLVAEAGATTLVVGRAFWGAEDPADAVSKMRPNASAI